MGQQQLILLVLSTVIVGLAIVVGVRAFSENSIKANADAMTQDAIRIASDAQAWKKKPAPFGGQPTGATKADPANYSDLTGVGELGYQAAGGGAKTYQNLNGCYVLTTAADGLTITGTNATEQVQISIKVDGLSDTNINEAADPILGNPTTALTDPCAGTGS